jgi:HD-GYP domain-containing protein (c-di-GMP phosphodiesterase class II)
MDILERFAIHRCDLDAEGRLLPGEPGFWRLLGLAPPSRPLPAAEVLDELVGREEDVRNIAGGGEGEICIPGIRRGMSYFDLYLIPAGHGAAAIVLKDCSDAMRAQQVLLQQRNEIDLLKRDIDKRNVRLKELMETVREQNHDLTMKVRLKTKDLRQSRLSVIARLARVAEFRDKETGGHIYRIGRSSVLVGRRCGLSTEDCEELFHASLLHDVGKVGIPDSILLKPGPLSPEERSVMQTHTLIGAELLAGDESRLLKNARDVARFHHERWDGTGYPEARAAEAIPLVARICAIVDVFDALLSQRPYKEAWSPERALDLIRREAGSSFDPSVAASFFEVAPDIVKLRQDASEPEGIEFLPEFY